MFADQDKLTDFTQWLSEQPDSESKGYVDSVHDVADLSVTLYWHGESTLQSEAVKHARAAGISVSFQGWPYTQKHTQTAVARAWSLLASDKDFQHVFTIADIVTFDPGHPGLVIEGDWAPGSTLNSHEKEKFLQDTEVRVQETTQIDVSLKPGVQAGPANATRSNDVQPFNAGGYMISTSTNGAVCSSVFAIRLNGVSHTTTARHCDEDPWKARDGSARYGSIIMTGDSGWAILSNSGSSLSFDGAWNNPDGYTKNVHSLISGLAVGDTVCTGGGNSGVHSTIHLTTRASFDDTHGAFDIWKALQSKTDDIAMIQGDSGGPVFTLNGSSTTSIRAAGMIQAWFSPTMTGSACGSVHDAGANKCTRTVGFTNESAILAQSGATLITS